MAAVCLRDVRAALAEHTLADCQALRDAVLGAPSSVTARAVAGDLAAMQSAAEGVSSAR
jgi:hypothetical protein